MDETKQKHTIKKPILIYLIIIACQLLAIIYWANKKQNYYIDEYYSMGYASSYTGRGDTAQYIDWGPEWKYGEWISNSQLRHYLLLDEDESLLSQSGIDAIKSLLLRRNYFGLLNIAESIYGYNQISLIPAIILNSFLFILAQVSLISLLKKINVDQKNIYAAVALFGFSAYMISVVEYVRFYMLVILFQLFILNLFYKAWKTTNTVRYYVYLVLILLCTFLSFRNSEFALVFFVCINICFFIAVYCKKRNKIVPLIIICFLGLLYVLTRTNYIQILFKPSAFTDVSDTRMVNFARRLRRINVKNTIDRMSGLMELFGEKYFGSYTFMLLSVLIISIYVMLNSRDIKKGVFRQYYITRLSVKMRPVTLILLGVWCVTYLLFSESTLATIVITIGILSLVLYTIIDSSDITIKRISLSDDAQYVSIILMTSIMYTFVISAASFDTWRYYCYSFVINTIVIWFLADRIIKRLKRVLHENGIKKLYNVVVIFVFISSLSPFYVRNIENIYETDKTLKIQLADYNSSNVILVDSLDDSETAFRHTLYDCVTLLSETSNIYALDMETYSFRETGLPRRFLLWCHAGSDIENLLNHLQSIGYIVEELGKNHVSMVRMCEYNGKNFLKEPE